MFAQSSCKSVKSPDRADEYRIGSDRILECNQLPLFRTRLGIMDRHVKGQISFLIPNVTLELIYSLITSSRLSDLHFLFFSVGRSVGQEIHQSYFTWKSTQCMYEAYIHPVPSRPEGIRVSQSVRSSSKLISWPRLHLFFYGRKYSFAINLDRYECYSPTDRPTDCVLGMQWSDSVSALSFLKECAMDECTDHNQYGDR